MAHSVPDDIPQTGHNAARPEPPVRASLSNENVPKLRPGSIDNIVDNPVFLRLRSRHDEVPLHVPLDPLQRLARARAHQLVRYLTNAQNLARMDIDVGCLSAQSAH